MFTRGPSWNRTKLKGFAVLHITALTTDLNLEFLLSFHPFVVLTNLHIEDQKYSFHTFYSNNHRIQAQYVETLVDN